MDRIKIAQIGVGHDHSDLITSLIRQSDTQSLSVRSLKLLIVSPI